MKIFLLFFVNLSYPHNWNWEPFPGIKCKSCHEIHGGIPGQFLAKVNGNVNLCQSLCHNAGGEASHFVISHSDTAIPGTQGNSHNFDTPGDDPGYDASTSTATLPKYVEDGKLVCSSCHDVHNHNDGRPFLVVDIDTVYTLCNDCHSPRDQSVPPFTSHPVGVPIPVSGDYTTPSHLPLYSGQIECTSCHDVHYSYSDTTYRGIAERGSPQSLVDLDATWVPNQFQGWQVKIYAQASSDTGAWFQVRTIWTNTSDSLYWLDSLPKGAKPSSGDAYVIKKISGGDGYLLNQRFKEICSQCHTYSSPNLYSGIHLNSTSGALWPGGQYGTDYAYIKNTDEVLPPARKSVAIDSSSLPVGFRGACINCHWPHGWPDGIGGKYRKLLVEESGSPTDFDEKLCLTCHDGAPVALNIDSLLSGSKIYTDEVTNRKVNTHHDIRLSEKAFSGAKVPCVSCHNPHKIGRDDPTTTMIREDLINPDNPDSIWQWSGTPAWGGDTDPERTLTHFCLTCHDGTLPSTVTPPTVALRNIKNSWDPNDGITPDDLMGPAGRDIPCTKCHAVHGSYNPVWDAGTNPETLGNLYMLVDSLDPASPGGGDYGKNRAIAKRTWVDSTSNPVWNPWKGQLEVHNRVFMANACDPCHWSTRLDMSKNSCSNCHYHGSNRF